MANPRRFRILMPKRGLSQDTYVLPPKQPGHIQSGCTALIHEPSGALLTVCDTQIFPSETVGVLPMCDVRKGDYLKYDRVQGVIEVRLSRPDRMDNARRMVDASGLPAPLNHEINHDERHR